MNHNIEIGGATPKNSAHATSYSSPENGIPQVNIPQHCGVGGGSGGGDDRRVITYARAVQPRHFAKTEPDHLQRDKQAFFLNAKCLMSRGTHILESNSCKGEFNPS